MYIQYKEVHFNTLFIYSHILICVMKGTPLGWDLDDDYCEPHYGHVHISDYGP
jgi:hypothetical protein